MARRSIKVAAIIVPITIGIFVHSYQSYLIYQDHYPNDAFNIADQLIIMFDPIREIIYEMKDRTDRRLVWCVIIDCGFKKNSEQTRLDNMKGIEENANQITGRQLTAILPYSDPVNYMGSTTGYVTKVADSGVLNIDNAVIRFALIETSKSGSAEYSNALKFLMKECPVSSIAIYNVDKYQKRAARGEILAKVWCSGIPPESPQKSINAILLDAGYAITHQESCKESEFGREEWARIHGC